MMALFSFLSGNTKSVDKVVDAGISGLDKLFFTEEEKADYNNKLQKLHLEFVKIAANESTAQSISRRMICLPVVYVWLLLTVGSVVAELFSLPTEAIKHAVEVMSLPALTAIGFYCGRHIANNFGKKS
tara:strand:- start:155 stop:538 length:384 start_codon:yes stop_codon:yes gene_type:complete